MEDDKKPVLLPGVTRHRWGANPATGEHIGSNEDALRQMCDYGAKQVAAGKCDFLALECMPNEVQFVNAYMAERHPSVGYAFGSGQRVLREATDRWLFTRRSVVNPQGLEP